MRHRCAAKPPSKPTAQAPTNTAHVQNFDGLPLLRRLRLSHVLNQGYTSLRCNWAAHCPVYLNPTLSKPDTNEFVIDHAFARAWKAFFPSTPIPAEVGHPCCAQFAVSKEAVLRRPRSDYERFRAWVAASGETSLRTGHVMEYLWHAMFLEGAPAIWCPEVRGCLCETYGLCDVQCSDKGCVWPDSDEDT